ncbi:hypothetical protein BGZ76_004564 [Entomortierella beljakovae]|nr:hypothetical protein BGZ76_004564 [Entomortierella beljakovae]
MDTFEHSSRSSALPSRLRWRPYSNGHTFKVKKPKTEEDSSQESEIHRQQQQQQHQQQQQQQQEQQQEQQLLQQLLLRHQHKNQPENNVKVDIGINPKALAYKIRSSPKSRSSSTVQLQWEEAETIESMSHGGHPQSHLYYRNSHDHHSDSDGDTNSSVRSHSQQTLPSPSSPVSATLDILGRGNRRSSNKNKIKATTPGINGDDFLQLGLPLPKFEDNTYYKAALNALLDNHRKNQILDSQAPALALTSVPSPISVSSPPGDFSAPSSKYPVSPPIDDCHSLKRKLSSSEMLGIMNIDDLLASCGYTDEQDSILSVKQPNGSLVSPATTNNSSPISPPLDKMVDMSSPTYMSSAYFEKLMAQTPVLLAEGDSSESLVVDDDSSLWPSLFPTSQEEVQMQTESGFHDPTLLPLHTQPASPTSSNSILSSPLLMHFGLNQEPEWLSYLDDSSPLISNTNNDNAIDSSGPQSSQFDIPSNLTHDLSESTPTEPERETGISAWAKSTFHANAVNPTGHGVFAPFRTSSSPFSTGSSLSPLRGSTGDLVKSAGYHTKSSARKTTNVKSRTKPKAKTEVIKIKTEQSAAPQLQPQAAATKNSCSTSASKGTGDSKTEIGGIGGLLASFRGLGLWGGKGRD